MFKTLRKAAFTMAEILLSLTIIGVVAAITLPSLTGNINERTWTTQKKALYSRLSQAIALMPQVRGFGTLNISQKDNGGGYGQRPHYESDDAAETFITSGLSKVFKLNNICDSNHLSDCGLPDQFINIKGSKIGLSSLKELKELNSAFASAGCGQYFAVNTKAAAFETANGESILFYYNPVCKDIDTGFSLDIAQSDSHVRGTVFMCGSLIFDLNGKKGPNTIGKDVGIMGLFYPSDSVLVMPLPANSNASDSATVAEGSQACTAQGDDLRLPSKEELVTISINYPFFALEEGNYWSSSPVEVKAILDNYSPGERLNYRMMSTSNYPELYVWRVNTKYAIRCVKR